MEICELLYILNKNILITTLIPKGILCHSSRIFRGNTQTFM